MSEEILNFPFPNSVNSENSVISSKLPDFACE
jgi:hypothetical protein